MAITVSINEPTISVTSADSPSVNVSLTSSTLQVVESNDILANTDGLPEGTYNKYYYTTRLLTDLQNIFDAGIQVNTLTVGTLNNLSENTVIHGSARVLETLYLGKPANYEQGIVIGAGTAGNAVVATDPTTHRLKWNYSSDGITSSAWYELPRTTDDLAEGSTNLYHTQERVEDTVANMVNGGQGLVTSYNDATGVLTISVDPTEAATMTDLTLTGNLTTQNIIIPVDGNNSGVKRGIQGTVGTDDYWFIGAASTSTTGPLGSGDGTAGYLEIATANNGTEPIYVRQYNTSGLPWDTAPGGTIKTLTLLDSSGNTQMPGTLQVSGNIIKSSTGGSAITLSGNSIIVGSSTQTSGLTVTANATISGDIAVNGGDLTTTASTFRLLPSNVTTLTIGENMNNGYIGIGNSNKTGYTEIRNPVNFLDGASVYRRTFHGFDAPRILTVSNTLDPSSSEPTAGIGASIMFNVETSRGNTEDGLLFSAVATDVTPGQEDFDFVIFLMENGYANYTSDKFRVRSTGDIYVRRNITLDGDSIDIGSRSQIQAPTGISSNDTAAVILDSFAKTAYRTAKYIIQATTSSATHSAEALVIHDGTDSQVSIYAELKSTTAGLWTNLTTTIAGSNVELSVTPASAAPTNFKVTKILMV